MQENINIDNDMIRENIRRDRFEAAKSTLMKDDGKCFHAMLGIHKKQKALPTEIGTYIFLAFPIKKSTLMVYRHKMPPKNDSR
jgi:hypothetical protein